MRQMIFNLFFFVSVSRVWVCYILSTQLVLFTSKVGTFWLGDSLRDKTKVWVGIGTGVSQGFSCGG